MCASVLLFESTKSQQTEFRIGVSIRINLLSLRMIHRQTGEPICTGANRKPIKIQIIVRGFTAGKNWFAGWRCITPPPPPPSLCIYISVYIHTYIGHVDAIDQRDLFHREYEVLGGQLLGQLSEWSSIFTIHKVTICIITLYKVTICIFATHKVTTCQRSSIFTIFTWEDSSWVCSAARRRP
jgi:hypothetical protein